MPDGHYLVLTTCPPTAARALAESVLAERLAVCVNILPEVRSIYRWKGAVEEGQETLLLIKTTAACYPRLEQHVRAHHPYELPEIIALDVTAGSAAYLAWIGEHCRPD